MLGEIGIIKEGTISLKRRIISVFLSGMFYLALGVFILSINSPTPVSINPFSQTKVDVKFIEKIVKKPKPVIIKPKIEKKSVSIVKKHSIQRAKVGTPFIPKHLKVKKIDKPITKKLVAPTEVPKIPPKEADPSQDKGVAVYGNYSPSKADPLGLEGGVAGAETELEPIRLPENAIPPQPYPDNPLPQYPLEAKIKGLNGLVILKVIIDEKGQVTKAEVLRGKEPFAAAAIAAVKHWRYRPAIYQGKPICVYRIIKIPFKIKT